MEDVPTTLRVLRAQLRWKQDRLAEHLGVSQATISRWEAGLSAPDKDQIEAIQALMGSRYGKKGTE
jgi:transcriptional regulator with XRE-family HTH domain